MVILLLDIVLFCHFFSFFWPVFLNFQGNHLSPIFYPFCFFLIKNWAHFKNQIAYTTLRIPVQIHAKFQRCAIIFVEGDQS